MKNLRETIYKTKLYSNMVVFIHFRVEEFFSRVGIQGHIAANTANTVNATTGVGGGGKSVEELDRALNGH